MAYICKRCGSEVEKYISYTITKVYSIKKNKKNGKCVYKYVEKENPIYKCIRCQDEWHNLDDVTSGWKDKNKKRKNTYEK